MNIPIQNIYYLLCYAWNKLDEQGRVAVSIDDRTSLLDLFAKVLNNAVRILLKRGIDRSYVEHMEEISGIKGKLLLGETLQRNLLKRQRTICRFDEFSPDILTNQILVSTLRKLMRIKELDRDLKRETRHLLQMLPGITPIAIRTSHFSQVRLHRNNRFYDFILKVCRIIHDNILPGEETGEYLFADFRRDDHKMNRLFEEFIFQFYTRELKGWRVRRETIKWKFDSSNDSDLTFLPEMKTDITLEKGEKKIIIDAKFYRETLATHYDKQKVKSANLYQLFSYLKNQESLDDPRTMSARGILLYPTIEREYDLQYTFDKHTVEIRTVNLGWDWKQIEARLKKLVEEYQ